MRRKKPETRSRFKQVPVSEISAPRLKRRLAASRQTKQKPSPELNGASARNHRHNGSQRKAKNISVNLAKDLWISPTLNLRGRYGDRAWDRSGNLPPGTGMRLLELADVALGLKKPAHLKSHGNSHAHQTAKNEPYSI